MIRANGERERWETLTFRQCAGYCRLVVPGRGSDVRILGNRKRFFGDAKRNRINVKQIEQGLHAYDEIPIQFVDVNLMQALTIAEQFNVYAYDAYIIAVALDQNCPLLTLDGGLASAARAAGVTVIEVTK